MTVSGPRILTRSREDKYDQDLASLFWGLQVPQDQCPEDPRKLENKIKFCLDKIKTWDPRL